MIINILIDHKDSFLDYKSILISKLKKLKHKVYFSSNYKKLKRRSISNYYNKNSNSKIFR